MAGKGTLTVRVIGDAKPLEKTLGGIGKNLAKFGAVAATAGAAVGAAFFKAGEQFDDAFDTIRVGTGATGKALEKLQKEFRDVVRKVPTDFASAGQAIADLNTRLGLTGDDLEEVTSQMLELSRITDTDLGANIETVTRVFGDWGVQTDDMSDAMDKLFRTSQATGPSVDRLGQMLVQYGAPLRQLGFSFEESAAMLGKFEKEGVNTELVMGSLRIALGKMAREGEPAIETFSRVVEEIKNAGSASEANKLALELFGARAGPDMAAAIREGRFSIEELVATIESGGDTIMGAAEETRDLSESWQLFKNNVLLAIEPIATRVFDAVGSFAEDHGPRVANFINQKLIPAFESVIETVEEWWPKVVDAYENVSEAVTSFWEEFKPAMDDIKTIVKAVGTIFQQEFRRASDSVADLEESTSDDSESMIATLRGLVSAVADITSFIADKWSWVRDAITLNFDQIGMRLGRMATQEMVEFVSNMGDHLARWAQENAGFVGKVTDIWLAWVETLVRGAEKAFGWVPGLKGPLNRAVAEVASFRQRTNEQLARVTREVGVRITGSNSQLISEIQEASRWLNSLPRTITVRLAADNRIAANVSGRRHSGGSVTSGNTFLVGERGPELFTPQSAGHITSNSGLITGGNQQLNVVKAVMLKVGEVLHEGITHLNELTQMQVERTDSWFARVVESMNKLGDAVHNTVGAGLQGVTGAVGDLRETNASGFDRTAAALAGIQSAIANLELSAGSMSAPAPSGGGSGININVTSPASPRQIASAVNRVTRTRSWGRRW